MPWREFRRAGFLHQHMFVKDACTLRAHQSLSHRSSRTMLDEILERFNALPVAVVAKEAPGCFLGRVVPERRSRMSGVVLHTFTQRLDPVLEHSAQDGGAVQLKRFPFCCQHAALL